jgi:serine/threonine protein kinase/Tfp pilus assembly protein PilF
MSRERWNRIDELFHSALKLEPPGRAAFLAVACGADTSLRSEVEALLEADRDAGSFLERNRGRAAAALEPGLSLGAYQILGLIARGGMGEVYRARDTRLVRDVAIKVLPWAAAPLGEQEKLVQEDTEWATTLAPSHEPVPTRPGEESSGDRAYPSVAPASRDAPKIGSEISSGSVAAALPFGEVRSREAELLRRFETEALLTASVQHPAVVPVYERGQLPDGRQFYAMKLISGRSLRELIDECKTLADRMALLPNVIAVAEALAHAHSQRIVHRDVKPSNVVVGEFGEALLIDWGVAKNLAADSQEAQLGGASPASDRTAVGAIIGTPAYMSPEQAKGLPIDERSDVFSLGATLYHLLAGRAPYEGETMAILPRVALGDYAPLSESAPDLPGELAAIVNKAMARETSGRYPTARELAEDLRRFQTGQLVLSHSYSARELLFRWARRNKALLVAVAVFLALAAVGAVISVRRIVAERDRANREAEASQRVSQFMTEMFRVSDPSEARGNNITAREILDKASKQIEGGLSRDPEVQARLMDTMARVFQSLGLYAKARPLEEKAVELRQRLLGAEHVDTLRSMNVLASIIKDQGQYADAEKLHQRVLDARRRVLGPEHSDTLDSMNNLAIVKHHLGKYAEAAALYRQAIDIRRRLLGPEHPRTLVSMHNLGLAEQAQGHYAEAEKLNREILDIRRRTLGAEHPETLNSMHNLAIVEQAQGHYADSQKLTQEVLEIRRRVLGPEHPGTLMSMHNLADIDLALGQYADARKLFLEAIEISRRTLGPQHPDLIKPMGGLGVAFLAEKQFAGAEKIFREALDISRRALGPEHPDTLRVMHKLAEAQIALGRYADAEKLYREVLEIQRRVLSPEHPNTLDTMFGLANLDAKQGRYDDAERMHLETLAIRRRALGPDHVRVGSSLYSLGTLALRRGDRKKALDYLRQAVDHGLSRAEAMRMHGDEDLAQLNGDPEFEAIAAEAKKRAQRQ